MPLAYEDVVFAKDPAAHLQAVGRDAAGRLQYRYHPQWEKVRETPKARRLERLATVLPRIRRSVAQHLGGKSSAPGIALLPQGQFARPMKNAGRRSACPPGGPL